MLEDKTQTEKFRNSKHWDSPLLDFRLRIPREAGDEKKGYWSNSLSGNERNRLVMAGENGFSDRSLVSGVDCKEDARSFALLDYDQDGWVDMLLASCNDPRLRLFRNRFGELGGKGSVLEVDLQGGHRQAKGTGSLSNRDAVGAVLTATTNRGVRRFRKSIGEGLAAQNTRKIRVTLAEGEILKELEVRWPSGKVTKAEPKKGERLMMIREPGQ